VRQHPERLGFALLLAFLSPAAAQEYPIVDTGQDTCYDDGGDVIADPSPGAAFHGQDAQYDGHLPSYTVSADRLTVRDDNTGLIWQQSADLDGDGDIDADDTLTWDEALSFVGTINAVGYAGQHDWRLPSIKELYSLILFTGIDPSGWSGTDPSLLTPFIDTDHFDFAYGDTDAGERLIDAQYWSATAYVSTTMGGDATAFGVNFADGRIKGYPAEPIGPPGNQFTKKSYVRYVRGNPVYGVNELVADADVVTDLATGLVWQRADDGLARNWEASLSYCQNLTLATCNDWRLPDAKALQSIVDYTRSPDTTGSAAIDPLFYTSTIVDEAGGTDFPFYWTGTTHANMSPSPGRWAVYVAFGEALGWMQPPGGGGYVLMDVHGAGAQRSDPKSGDPDDWPYGNGPQGDVVRIDNFVRCVRGATVPACEIRVAGATPTSIELHPTCPPPSVNVATGLLSELRTDRGFDTRPAPATGEGYYYLARSLGSACSSRGYGEAHGVTPDPRDLLETLDPCP
jgi:hypothetical protein